MNLQGIVAPFIGAINPNITVCIQKSSGSTTNADGSLTPTYDQYPNVGAQAQPISSSDLRKMDGLPLQGIYQAVYLNGHWNGVVRPAMKGGDLLTFPDGTIWLVTQVLEYWPDWTKVAVTLQNGS